MPLRIELVQPALSKFLTKRPSKWIAPPLGLATLASLNPDSECHITDEAIENIDFDKDIDIVAIRTVTATSLHAYEIADKFRLRGVKVILGGPHPTLCPEEAADHADAVVIGEAEASWQQLISDLKNTNLQRIYRPSQLPSLADMPLPRRDLYKKDRYFVTTTLSATRGCPYSCSFCSITPLWGHSFRTRPVDDVLQEIEALNSKMIFFIDDNLVGNPQYAKDLFRELAAYKKKWFCQASITVARDQELLRLAAKAGCIAMAVGFESISSQNLAYVNKKTNVVEEYEHAVKQIHSYGIAIHGSFMFGFDEDDKGIFDRTLQFIQKVGLETACFAPITPYPGTPLFDSMEREGRILNRDWFNYADIDGGVNFQPKLMTAQELTDGMNSIWKDLWSLPSIWKRFHRRNPFHAWQFALLNLGIRYFSSSLSSSLAPIQNFFGMLLGFVSKGGKTEDTIQNESVRGLECNKTASSAT
ncbi:MAG: radical SAM protein [Chloroflexota bacterium]|nr:radical SAM protein [Chloroflexota bacterium]